MQEDGHLPDKWGSEWDPDSTGYGLPLVPLRSIVSHFNLTLSSHTSPGFLLVRSFGRREQSTASIVAVGPKAIAVTHLSCLLIFLESPPLASLVDIPEGSEPLVAKGLIRMWLMYLPVDSLNWALKVRDTPW